MRLNLGSLQRVVKLTIDEGKAVEALKEEIGRVFGPTVITEGKIENVAMAANDWLDVLDRTGRSRRLEFKPAATVSFLEYAHPEVRKFAARVVPEKFLSKMINDKNPEVRAAVAGRVPLDVVREMMKRFPSDDQLRSILRTRKLTEAGMPKPEVKPMGHDHAQDKKRQGDAVRTQPGPELSEAWYDEKASEMIHQYGRNIEYAWEEKAVNRYCSSVKATSGVEIDESKLLKSIKGLIKEKEDDTMERNSLKETLSWLASQEEKENLTEGLMPDISEDTDPVQDLVEGGLSSDQFLKTGSVLFSIQESMLPLGIRKYRLGEGNMRQVLVPCIGMLPHRGGFRAIDERALDAFCEHWSRKQALAGEPLVLAWTNHPQDFNKISFNCSLK
jgi:hypothetical protein